MAYHPSSCPNLKMANMFSYTNLKNSQQVHFSVKSLATSQKVPHTCLIVFVFKLTWSAVNIYNMFKLFASFFLNSGLKINYCSCGIAIICYPKSDKARYFQSSCLQDTNGKRNY